MKFKFLIVITLASACEAFKKDSMKEMEDFVNLTTLGNLWTYLANGMKDTIKCYLPIKNEYETAIDEFKKDAKKGIEIMDKYYVDPTYKYYAKASFEELYKIANALYLFKAHFNFKINDEDVKEAIEYAQVIKTKVQTHYKAFIKLKEFFYPEPLKYSSYYYDYEKISRGKFIKKIRRPAEKFIKCGESHRQLINFRKKN